MKTEIKTFHQLTNLELYEILQLRAEIFVVEQNCVCNDLDGLDVQGMHVMIKEKNAIVAYTRLLPKGARFSKASIGRVVSKASHRGKHLGKQVMQVSIDFILCDWKESEIKISAQSYLQGFYEDLGFKIVSEEYLEDGIPHFEMRYETKKHHFDH